MWNLKNLLESGLRSSFCVLIRDIMHIKEFLTILRQLHYCHTGEGSCCVLFSVRTGTERAHIDHVTGFAERTLNNKPILGVHKRL